MGMARWAMCVGLALLGSCDGPTAPAPTPVVRVAKPEPLIARWDGFATKRHVDGPSALAFAIPDVGFRITAEHFDEKTTELHQFVHSFTLVAPAGPAVSIDVWRNPERTPLGAWFDKHLAYLLAPGSTASRKPSRIVISQPRSPQSYGRRVEVFVLGGPGHEQRMVRVTLHNEADEPSRKAYERVLITLEPSAALPAGATWPATAGAAP